MEELQNLFDPATITPWDLAFAFLATLTSWIAANIARRGVLALLGRVRGLTATARSLAGRIVKYAIILVGVGVGLSFLGASVQPLLAMAIIAGVVLVLALRGISTNFAAGIVLQTRQPIKIGDEIACDRYVGVVEELNARSVVIITSDGRRVHVPNGYLLEHPLVNDSVLSARRTEIEARVALADRTPADVVDLAKRAVGAVDGVHAKPDVRVLITLLAPDRVTLRIRFWHDPRARASTSSAVVLTLSSAYRHSGLASTVTSELPTPPLTSPPPL